MKKTYSREELLTPELRQRLPEYRRRHREWREKYPKTEEAKEKALALLRSVATGYQGPLENISGNFREYMYNRLETEAQRPQREKRSGKRKMK